MNDIGLFSSTDYNLLLELTYEVVQALKGKKVDDERSPYVQHLAFKLYSHATSSIWLYHGTKSLVPRSTNGSDFIDNGSIVVLARSALETYLSFYEVFIEPSNDDEFEFSYCLWNLSGKILLEDYEPLADTHLDKLETIYKEIEDLRNRITKTQKYKDITDKQQIQVLKGKRLRGRRDVAKLAGFSPYFIDMVYKYYSGYVHSDGYSTSKLFYTDTREKQVEFAETQLNFIMMVLSKFILDYTGKFDETTYVLEKFPEGYQLAQLWSNVASRISP